jgi:hypothetical protein
MALTAEEMKAGACPACGEALPREVGTRRRYEETAHDDPASVAAAWQTVRRGLLFIVIGESIQVGGTVAFALLFRYWTADGQPQKLDVNELPNSFLLAAFAFLALAPMLVSVALWLFGMVRCLWAPRARAWVIAALCWWALMIVIPTCLRPWPGDAMSAFYGLLYLHLVCLTLFLSIVTWHCDDIVHAAACWLLLAIFTLWWFVPTLLRWIAPNQLTEVRDLYETSELFIGLIFLVFHLGLVFTARRVIARRLKQQAVSSGGPS